MPIIIKLNSRLAVSQYKNATIQRIFLTNGASSGNLMSRELAALSKKGMDLMSTARFSQIIVTIRAKQ